MFKQKNLLKTITISGLTVFLSVLIVTAIVRAGSLTPSGSDVDGGTPTSTSYTLANIYNRLNTNATAIAGNHSFVAPVGAPTSTFYTLTQIYNKIPTINPANLLSSTTYLGITGSIVPRGAFGLTASSSSQSVSAGYYTGGTLAGDADLTAGNIKSGVNLFGVAGSYGGGGYTYGSDLAKYVLTSAGAGAGTFNANNLNSSLIATGTAWGTSSVGTLLGHLWNGSLTAGGFPGGSQTNGGVDDFNNGNAAGRPEDSYSSGWTKCTSGADNYCGTGDAFAAYKDNITSLIWSKPCNGNGCFTYSTSSPVTYNWDQRGTANYNATTSASSTAAQLCSNNMMGAPMNKSYHGSGWSLPHQKQLLLAYVDGSYGNLDTGNVNRYYWSATTVSNDTTQAWETSLSLGRTTYFPKTATGFIRCVR